MVDNNNKLEGTDSEQAESIQADGSCDKKIGKKKRKFLLISLAAVAVVCIVVIFVILNIQYNNAVSAYENENYSSAYKYFKKSNFRKSDYYLEKTLEKYTTQLIDNKDFTNAEYYMKQIKNTEEQTKLQQKLIYVQGMDLFEQGLFEDAHDLFKKISAYEDAKEYGKKAEYMNKIQGVWALHGTVVDFYKPFKDYVMAAFTIDGWEAVFYIKVKDVFYEVGKCTLTVIDADTALYKAKDLECRITYPKIDCLGVEITKGETLDYVDARVIIGLS